MWFSPKINYSCTNDIQHTTVCGATQIDVWIYGHQSTPFQSSRYQSLLVLTCYKVQSRAYISSQYVEVNNNSNRLFLLVVPVSHPGVCGDNEDTMLLAPQHWTRVTWVIDYEYNGIDVQHMVTAHFADLKTKIRFYQIKYKYV